MMKSAKKIRAEEVLQRVYPRLYRVALALCQDRSAGLAVVARVLRQSGVALDRWENDAEADRWFLRYAVLCSRGQAPGKDDPLFTLAQDALSKGMILAIRHLPMQQREAYLLHHGEGLDLRQLATAMDCSSSAAANHLAAAEEGLRPIGGDRLAGFAARLPGLILQLTPPPEMLEVEVNRVIRTRLRRIWIRRWILLPLKTALAIVLAWVIWKVWKRMAA